MSDDQKIWFIYLTDHHEGPFTPAEVAEKIGQGMLTAQSLGWKDGMPEWLPIESIPELSAVSGGDAPAPLPAAEAGQGLALVPQEYAREEIAAGRLALALDKPWPARFAYYVVMLPDAARRPEVAAFVEWLAQEARQPACT